MQRVTRMSETWADLDLPSLSCAISAITVAHKCKWQSANASHNRITGSVLLPPPITLCASSKRTLLGKSLASSSGEPQNTCTSDADQSFDWQSGLQTDRQRTGA